MTVKIKKQTAGGGITRIVEEMSGVDLSACYQCMKCTSGCPVAKLTESPPSEIVRRLHLGAGSELLESDLIWMCLSCETCYARCPMDINVAAVIDALRALALEKKAATAKGSIPLFNRLFLRMVRSFGRIYEIPMLVAHRVRTRNFMMDTEKLPEMLAKRKLALLPPSGADRGAVKRVFDRARGTGQ